MPVQTAQDTCCLHKGCILLRRGCILLLISLYVYTHIFVYVYLQMILPMHITVHSAAQGLHSAAQGLPSATQGLHSATQGLHCATQGLHSAAQGLHSAAQGPQRASREPRIPSRRPPPAHTVISRSSVAMNAWLPQASIPVATFLTPIAEYLSDLKERQATRRAWTQSQAHYLTIYHNPASADRSEGSRRILPRFTFSHRAAETSKGTTKGTQEHAGGLGKPFP